MATTPLTNVERQRRWRARRDNQARAADVRTGATIEGNPHEFTRATLAQLLALLQVGSATAEQSVNREDVVLMEITAEYADLPEELRQALDYAEDWISEPTASLIREGHPVRMAVHVEVLTDKRQRKAMARKLERDQDR